MFDNYAKNIYNKGCKGVNIEIQLIWACLSTGVNGCIGCKVCIKKG